MSDPWEEREALERQDWIDEQGNYVVLSADAWQAILEELKRGPKLDNQLADALAKPDAFRWVNFSAAKEPPPVEFGEEHDDSLLSPYLRG